MIFIFTAIYPSLHGFITNQNTDQLSPGSLAQLVSRCTGIAEFMDSNPIQASIYFRPYFHYCSRGVHSWEDRFHIHFLIRSSHIRFSSIHTHLIVNVVNSTPHRHQKYASFIYTTLGTETIPFLNSFPSYI